MLGRRLLGIGGRGGPQPLLLLDVVRKKQQEQSVVAPSTIGILMEGDDHAIHRRRHQRH